MKLPADAPPVSRPRSKLIAGALALGVHAVFVLLLVFGMSWQTQHPAPVKAEPAPRPVVEEPPPPKAPDIALEKKKAEA